MSKPTILTSLLGSYESDNEEEFKRYAHSISNGPELYNIQDMLIAIFKGRYSQTTLNYHRQKLEVIKEIFWKKVESSRKSHCLALLCMIYYKHEISELDYFLKTNMIIPWSKIIDSITTSRDPNQPKEVLKTYEYILIKTNYQALEGIEYPEAHEQTAQSGKLNKSVAKGILFYLKSKGQA